MGDTNHAERLKAASQRVHPPEPAFGRLGARRDRRRRRERTTSLVVGAALTLALIGGGVAAVRATQSAPPVPAATGHVPVARTPHLRPGQYLYRQQVIVTPACRIVITTWWASDNSGRIASRMTNPKRCAYGLPPSRVFGPGDFQWDSDTAGLSSDPSVLYLQMERRTAPGGRSPEPPVSPGPFLTPGVTVGSMWSSVVNLLEDPNSGPDLYAALFRVASEIPGVHVRRGVVDPAGRPAIALAGRAGSPPSISHEYFDPSTGQLMAEGGPPGTVGPSDTYYSEGIVESIRAIPSGNQWLFPPVHTAALPGVPSPTA